MNSAARHSCSGLRDPVNTNLIATLTQGNNFIKAAAKSEGKGRTVCSGKTQNGTDGFVLGQMSSLFPVNVQKDSEVVNIKFEQSLEFYYFF